MNSSGIPKFEASFAMHPLLIAATSAEIKPFLKVYTSAKTTDFKPVDILITGVGLLATTASLSRQIARKRPSLIIQAGIAGCFDKKIPLGTAVAIERDTVADMGVLENNNWHTLQDLKLAGTQKKIYTKGWLVNRQKKLLTPPGIRLVKGISVNQITTSSKMVALYRQQFNPVTESMEGAALHYCALLDAIPFLQIRGISNYIGERNKQRWKIKEAIDQTNHLLLHLLKA